MILSLALFLAGIFFYVILRFALTGIYTVDQNERAAKTVFGRAQRILGVTTHDDPISAHLNDEEKGRYKYPQLRVVQPGFHFKWPWERVFKVSVATETVNMAFDFEDPSANQGGTVLEAVTRDQLNIGLTGQIRYRVSERNLYAYLFGVKAPIVHVMGYFVSVLRERISNFKANQENSVFSGVPVVANEEATVSINDLRKNLREINDRMVEECRCAEARYGMVLDASLITGIDPPREVESALAAINTAHNNVSSSISVAQAAADQTIVQSKRAVEIETLKAQAEVKPIVALADELRELKDNGKDVLSAYVRNVRLALYSRAREFFLRGDL